ncbi:MAG: tungstate transport system permease protein [Myxococcales bacterium]|nr:tungstate transport system permease protein [Myxococcales bacterium]
MREILDGLLQGFRLLLAGDPEIWGTTARSLLISGSATILATLVALPFGIWVAIGRVPARGAVRAALYAGMGMPTVLVGLVLTMLFWREGPLGGFGLLFTPTAVTLGQVVIAFPIVAGLTASAMSAIEPRVVLQVRALGASPLQAARLLALEARPGLIVAVLAGFGHALSEVGAAMMLGGNLAGETRVLTTATVLAARMGKFDLAVGLAFLLFAIALFANGGAALLQPKARR